ncbi:bifunctional UDP-N-acetylglucosamine diphosphorylase/glucosamine-1-phosphate N-acetyltransferase GlmU [Dermabacteraceae bacterium TAE3-ERU27]|nr:bifunctional UDP-N-acetylglucosamine diphosphorylase/glucosamine-1-phosphate N-acetyltransferase GlmU [Dermabacteraceae bacterium TAE3-ERU27]
MSEPSSVSSQLAGVVVLAAGAGTRMKSSLPKVLHPMCGRALVHHAIEAARAVNPSDLVVVVRHEREQVVSHLADVAADALIADQDDIPGTGRAVQCGLEEVKAEDGTVLVTYGDVPLLDGETLNGLVSAHEEAGNAVTVLTALLDDATGYGRILRDGDAVTGIVEHKDATPEQLAINEVNSGIYAFDLRVLRDALGRVGTDNAQGEMYLTDVLAIAREAGGKVGALPIADALLVEGVNDKVQLATLGREMNRRIVEKHMREGVSVVDPATTWIGSDVTIGRDTVLLPGIQLNGACEIGSGCEIGPDSTLTDVKVGDGATVTRVHGVQAEIGPEATVGPFTYLRPGTVLGRKGKIGGFCETKNAVIGDGAKVPHLSYVGDAEVGEGTNIGAATIVANYDGVNKHRTKIGKHVRVGSDNVLVAPVTLGDGCATGAGTLVREEVPAGALGINEVRQRNIEGWTEARRAGTASAKAAAESRENGEGK